MPELSPKWLREGIERVVTKGVARVASEEVDLAKLIQNIAKSAWSMTAAKSEHVSEPGVRARDLGEALVSVVRSIDSLADLQERVHEHRGEFVDATRHFSQQLYVAFRHLAEPVQGRSGPYNSTRSEIAARSLDTKDDSTTEDEPGRSQGLDT